MLPKSFMLVISLLLCIWVHEAQATLAKPGCEERCGNVIIPYPYGIGIGCYMHKSFEVSCNKVSQDNAYLWFTNHNKFPILEISMESVRVGGMFLPSLCINSASTRLVNQIIDPHFSYSHKRNIFIATGCNISASFLSFGFGFSIEVGCTSNCSATAINNGSFDCNGSNGCCQINIPKETNAFQAVILDHGREQPCNYALIVEKEYNVLQTLNLSSQDIIEYTYKFPVTLNWVITLSSCHQARRRGDYDYVCGKNTQCVDSTKGERGHNCQCLKGYRGNPYLPTGCQDINECLSSSNYPCKEDQICINTPGSYKCTSPHTHMSIISGSIASVIGIFAFGSIGYWTYKEVGRRKEDRVKLEFFKRNGGFLLMQHITANKSNVMRIKVYDAKEIEKATNGFSQSRLLGRGGQGTVYKGFLTDGTIVAIKRSNVVDEDQVERFVNEVFILSQINHRNIVKLLGCCLESEVPLLVYEYLSNGTLSQHLHDGVEVSKFSWKDRIRVAGEVAEALAYLHSYASPAIFHRDVKPHNILLDDNYRAVVSDFGLSRSIPLSRTHLTTKIEGTFGYLDPEYFHSGKLTEKCDVYAFGVVLMELLTKKKVVYSTNCGEGLVSHFQLLVKQNRVIEILDQQVLDEALMDDIYTATKLAKTCMNKNAKERPSMREVAMDLNKLLVVQRELRS